MIILFRAEPNNRQFSPHLHVSRDSSWDPPDSAFSCYDGRVQRASYCM